MAHIRAQLLYNKKAKDNYGRCLLHAPLVAKEAVPGQFINIKLNDRLEPFLRRPLSIHRVRKASIEILYRVIGAGTLALSRKKPKEYLDVIGPLGEGFDVSLSGCTNQSPVLVAGGMGVAPLVFLAEKLAHGQTNYPERTRFVFIGAKTKKDLLCEKEFKQLGCQVMVATDDGSKGFRGNVTALLKKQLGTTGFHPAVIYACGPHPMLQEVAALSRRYAIPAQVSLEEHMACGIGACLGCVVATTAGFKRICKEGPVFEAREILWQKKGGR
jgi:dihydroorotate dehydrogenase electron transfer subunit